MALDDSEEDDDEEEEQEDGEDEEEGTDMESDLEQNKDDGNTNSDPFLGVSCQTDHKYARCLSPDLPDEMAWGTKKKLYYDTDYFATSKCFK